MQVLYLAGKGCLQVGQVISPLLGCWVSVVGLAGRACVCCWLWYNLLSLR